MPIIQGKILEGSTIIQMDGKLMMDWFLMGILIIEFSIDMMNLPEANFMSMQQNLFGAIAKEDYQILMA